jgi:hypothetical protein
MIKILFALTLLVTNTVYAQNVYSEQFQTVQSVEVVEVIEADNGDEIETIVDERNATFFSSLKPALSNKSNPTIPGALAATKEFIALGKQVYKIIEAGRPVVSSKSEPVQILPNDKSGELVDAFSLSDWSEPVVKKYRIRAKNYLGMSPATFEFILIFTPGGRFEGKGYYITGAQIKPTKMDVKWGYTLNAEFKVQSIMNAGSSKNPIAAAVLAIDYTISTVLQENTASRLFYINGLGKVKAY